MLVRVTQDHCNKAEAARDNSESLVTECCPVAYAMSNALGTRCFWGFDRGGTRDDPSRYFAAVKQDAAMVRDAVAIFDSGKRLQPFDFYVEEVFS